MNNIMLKSSSNQNGDAADAAGPAGPSIENVILIDFQYACWTSPAIDVQYLLNTSLQESLRPGRFAELIAIYHGHLVDCLKRLDYKKSIPSLSEFKKQYDDKKFYGMNIQQFHDLKSNDSYFMSMFQVLSSPV